MAGYNLSHLTQGNDPLQEQVQDDEALLLYALIRCMRLQTVLEVGALHGYSAQNFLAAVGYKGHVISVDINPLTSLAPNHLTIQSPIQDLDPATLPVLDLVFFDAHVYDEQLAFFHKAASLGKITPQTIIALHDTGLFPKQAVPHAYPVTTGWVHQPVERNMVNYFVHFGYKALCAHADDSSPPRKGVTILQMFTPLET